MRPRRRSQLLCVVLPTSDIFLADSRPAQLAPNVTQACCPKLTVCAHNYKHTTENVRCEIQLSQPPTSSTLVISSESTSTSTADNSDIVTGDTSSPSSSIPSTTSTSTTTPSPAPTNPTQTSTPLPPLLPPNPSPQSFNGTAIAGICVAAGSLLLLAFATGFFLRRRRKSPLAKNELDRQELSDAASYSLHPAYRYPPQEMGAAWSPPELGSDGRGGAE